MTHDVDQDEYWAHQAIEAFKWHLHEEHADRWRYNNDEIRMFEEECAYQESRDGEVKTWGCCYFGCDWQIQFTVRVLLQGNIKETFSSIHALEDDDDV